MNKIKYILSSAFLLICATAICQPRVVAVTEIVDKSEQIPYNIKFQIRTSLTRAISQKQGYSAVDRADISHIFDEQTFQRTGMVDNSTIQKLGNITGAKFVLITEVVTTNYHNSIYVSVKIIDVETARVTMSENSTISTTSIESGCNDLVNKVLGINPEIGTAGAIPVKLYNYLTVFPNDIGNFRSCPSAIITSINNSATHGYNNWRLPTDEELSLMRNMAHEIPGFRNTQYMTSSKDTYELPTAVRLVTTSTSIQQQQEDNLAESIESGRGANGVYKVGYYYNNGYKSGVVFSVSNGGRHGKIVTFVSPHNQNYYYVLENAHRHGRAPSLAELRELYNVINKVDQNPHSPLKRSWCWSATAGSQRYTAYMFNLGTGQSACHLYKATGAYCISIDEF